MEEIEGDGIFGDAVITLVPHFHYMVVIIIHA